MQVGDEVIINNPFWHEGVNIGDRLGIIISVEGYILVKVYDYESNPVKCFRSEVRKVIYDDEESSYIADEEDEDNLNNWLDMIYRT